MHKHEIFASWFSKEPDIGKSACRMAAVVQDDGATSFLVECATGQVAHVTFRSEDDPGDTSSVLPQTVPPCPERPAASFVALAKPAGWRPIFSAVVLHAVANAVTLAVVLFALLSVWPVVV